MSDPTHVLYVDGDGREPLEPEAASGRSNTDNEGSDADVTGPHEELADSFDVTTVRSVAEGIETLETSAVDCVVSRHELPDGTGIDLLSAVRQYREDLPFVLAPRSESERVAAMAARHGATDYVSDATADGSDGTDGMWLLERAAEAVERRNTTPFEQLPVGAVEWTKSLEFTRLNETAERILGYDRESLVGKPWTTIVPDDEVDQVREIVDSLRDGEPRMTVVNRNVTAAGETISCEWHHQVVTDDSGSIQSVVSTFQDVSDRVERERRVNELRSRLRELAFTTTKPETARVAVDAADEVMGARLSGVHLLSDDDSRLGPAVLTQDGAEAFGTPPSYDRDASPGTRDAFVWDVFESGEPRRVDDVEANEWIREESPAGSVIIYPIGDHGVFVVSAPESDAFTDTDEALAEILARTLTTALNRVEQEERRHERERRLSRLHEATQELIAAETEREVAERAVIAADEVLEFTITLIRFYDEEAGGLVPVAESDEVDDHLPPRTVFDPDGGSLNWEAYERGEVAVYDDIEETDALDSGSGLRSLMILPIGEYGTISVGEVEPNAFDDSDLSLARILATTVETVLEANERKAELRQQRDELERQNARLERFADVLSHDLRNPLTVAQGRLRLADQECDSEHHAAIERAHDRMATLIDDLLTLARRGNGVDESEPVALRAFLERCWDTVETGDAALRVATDATVEADPNRLQQLFENLFRNSVEHGSTGNRPQAGDSVEHGSTGNRPQAGDSAKHGVSEKADVGAGVTVTVGDLPNDEGFYVEDDGSGVPEELRSKVFDFGYTDSRDGTGLGLAIVAGIADAHGWTVELDESDAGGARFEFRTTSR